MRCASASGYAAPWASATSGACVRKKRTSSCAAPSIACRSMGQNVVRRSDVSSDAGIAFASFSYGSSCASAPCWTRIRLTQWPRSASSCPYAHQRSSRPSAVMKCESSCQNQFRICRRCSRCSSGSGGENGNVAPAKIPRLSRSDRNGPRRSRSTLPRARRRSLPRSVRPG